jgi:protein-L-isoaspartate(D-aspartate) O-methyltransferase
MHRGSLCILLFVLASWAAVAADVEEYAEARAHMLEMVQELAQGTDVLESRELDPSVLETMRAVPRHEFVPEHVRDEAYDNRPLPIGYGQTISQPFIVALMTDLLNVDEDDVVLEIGTGSGYQAALLSPLAGRVYTIEIVPELGRRAAKLLDRLGYDNVETKVGDGYYGWPEAGPFGAIMVTAAASQIPPPLIAQLEPGGRMAIPIGSAFFQQQLMLVEKKTDGSISTRQLLPVRFVPLARQES